MHSVAQISLAHNNPRICGYGERRWRIVQIACENKQWKPK